MGHVHVDAVVSARRKRRVRFLVDTGATFSIIPEQLVKELGATTLPTRFKVELADGRSKRLKACTIGIAIDNRAGPTTALVLPGSEPLLGVETLEALGLRVNPERHRLEPSRAKGAMLVGVRAAGALDHPIATAPQTLTLKPAVRADAGSQVAIAAHWPSEPSPAFNRAV